MLDAGVRGLGDAAALPVGGDAVGGGEAGGHRGDRPAWFLVVRAGGLAGSFLQVDTSLTTVETGTWSSEWERPIYFFETHSGYLCGFGAIVRSNELQVQPHTLSGLAAKTYRYPAEIEVVGQVVGIATKLRSGVNAWIERAQEAMREHS